MNEFMYKYTLKTCDFDRLKCLRPISLFHHLQDISTRHFDSVVEKQESSLWVIVSWDIEVYTQKVDLEHITVKTFPMFFRKFIGYRGYEVYRADGERIAKGTSKWVHLDRDSRKPKSIPEEINALFGLKKNVKPEEANLSVSGAPDIRAQNQHFYIYDSDIDINHHVNNVVYIRWALDGLKMMTSEDFHKNTLKNIHVRYRQEMYAGGHAKVETAIYHRPNDIQVVQEILNDRGDTCAEVISYWYGS